MKKILCFYLFLTLSTLLGIAQSFTMDSSNVHFFLPVGFSPSDIGRSVHHPNGSNTILAALYVVEMNGKIKVGLCPNGGVNPNNTNRDVNAIKSVYERALKGTGSYFEYDNSMSTSKREVYKRYVAPSMFGPAKNFYKALSPDFSSLIEWDSSSPDRRVEYYEVTYQDLLPNSSNVPNYDFLYE